MSGPLPSSPRPSAPTPALHDAGLGEAYFNFLGSREVDDDANMRIVNAYIPGQLVASIKYDLGRTVGGALFIHHVYVDPAFRGRKIMRQLADRAVDDAWYEDISTLDGDFNEPRLRDWFEALLEARFG